MKFLFFFYEYNMSIYVPKQLKAQDRINLKALLVTFLFSRGLNEYGK